MESYKSLALFEKKQIRRIWHNEEWYFSLVDIIGALTDSLNPTDYLKKIRKRDLELGVYMGTNCPQLEMVTQTGKRRKTLAGKGGGERKFSVVEVLKLSGCKE
jgi:DNA-damage-inducible protein D